MCHDRETDGKVGALQRSHCRVGCNCAVRSACLSDFSLLSHVCVSAPKVGDAAGVVVVVVVVRQVAACINMYSMYGM